MAKKPRKDLTYEDRYLWKKVTDTVKPHRQRQIDAVSLSDQDLFASAMKENLIFKAGKQPEIKAISPKKPIEAKPLNIYSASSKLPAITQMDRKTKSQFARGIKDIDGRIDLHGMTQQQAYEMLLTFIGRARASGWKTVLVITGKGAPSLDDDHSIYFEMGREAPGVLRRKVPQWLSEPEMRQFVISYDRAAPNHGGSGALYVRIRRHKT